MILATSLSPPFARRLVAQHDDPVAKTLPPPENSVMVRSARGSDTGRVNAMSSTTLADRPGSKPERRREDERLGRRAEARVDAVHLKPGGSAEQLAGGPERVRP